MSARSVSGIAARSRHSVSPTAVVSSADLERLVRDWRAQLARGERQQADSQNDRTALRLLQMQARVLLACLRDLEDVIAGREHPASRRGEQLSLGKVAHG